MSFCVHNKFSKIFDSDDLGYREIRIRMPLRLSFIINKERIEKLTSEYIFLKLEKQIQNKLIQAFQKNISNKLFLNKDEFKNLLDNIFKNEDITITSSLKKYLLLAFSEKDSQADICKNAKGKIEEDPELSYTVQIPLIENSKIYFEREVSSSIPDATVDEKYIDKKDHKVGKVGYEINFNRYFTQHISPRKVLDINTELKDLEIEIANLLKEVVLT